MLKLLLSLAILVLSTVANAQVTTCIDKNIMTSLGIGESGVMDMSSKWTNGSTIRVKFMGGSANVRQRIMQYAKTWEQFANIKLNFVEYGDADIRISFMRGGYYSVVGTMAKRVPQSQQTMNYEGFDDNLPDYMLKRTVLHEFGHALGLLHEHKSPFSKIQWHKDRTYAYYLQTQGWSPQQVDDQVMNRYTVTMTNSEYDPHSIMHYPVPAFLTVDGYEVNWNNDLSESDKKLIREMYPFATTTYPIGTIGNSLAITCNLENVAIDHNIFKDGKYGMKIKGKFQVNNSKGRNVKFVAYFYAANGTPLKDFNNQFKTVGGDVSVGGDIIPNYDNAVVSNELFIPYDELHLANGNHNLKAVISVFDDQLREIAKGGATYFTYRNGPVFSDIVNIQSFNNTNFTLTVMPKFTVQNARSEQLKVMAYFYYQNGNPVMFYNTSTGRYEPLVYANDFQPFYDITTYNYGYYSDLFMNVPYGYFPILNQRTYYKYYTAIFKNGQQVATSPWTNFTLDK